MSTASYPPAAMTLATSQAENQLFANEIAAEEQAYADHPEIERAELELLLREEMLTEEQARTAAAAISQSRFSLRS